ncbi:hypothetical protein PE067_06205 [Paracoccus sp. DMF-8]|uniref:hypothetical protein n=1 Tax=Paracoccus sp. DMF-8 TaxID=3019445 RepID=UPI0023E7B700|nr:hypothetical protein [Paracoccus sp. DMF-8]MDF3605773.1 hypothetical protein [Paracoccus sp. DMF-8]
MIAEELTARGEDAPDPATPPCPTVTTGDGALAQTCAELAAILSGIAASTNPAQAEARMREAARVQRPTAQLHRPTASPPARD